MVFFRWRLLRWQPLLGSETFNLFMFSKWALNSLKSRFRTIQRIYAKQCSWNNISHYPSIQSSFRSGSGTTQYVRNLGVFTCLQDNPKFPSDLSGADWGCTTRLSPATVNTKCRRIIENSNTWMIFSDPTSTALKYPSQLQIPHQKNTWLFTVSSIAPAVICNC